MKRLGAVLVALLAVLTFGCNLPIRPPDPTTPPPADQHVPVCADGNVSACWHQPPEGWRYNCPGGAPTVSDPAECGSAPPVTPGGPCAIPDAAAVRVEPVPAGDPAVMDAVNAAALKVAACPEGPPSRCVVEMTMRNFLAAVAAEVRAAGRCAGVQDGGNADEVCVETTPGRCQGIHIFACSADCNKGTVAWAPGSVRDTWTTTAAPSEPAPPATPAPPADGCTEPTPDVTLFKLHASWNQDRTVAWIDATGKAKSDWCEEMYGPSGPWSDPADPSKNRGTCPLRPEGHPERHACDVKHGKPQWLISTLGGFVPVASDDGEPFHVHAPAGSTVKACRSTGTGTWDEAACSDPLVLTP